MSWQVYALLSAIAAGATAVLAKLGVEGIPSNLATGIRTIVILALAWAIVIVVFNLLGSLLYLTVGREES